MLTVCPQPWGKIYFDPDSDEFWVELEPGQNDPRLSQILSISCHLAGSLSSSSRRQKSASLVDDWLYYQDRLQVAGAKRLLLVGAEKIPRSDAMRIVRAGLSRGFGMILSLADCGPELRGFLGFPEKTVLRTVVDPNRILGLQRKGGPSLAWRIERLRDCAAAGLRVRVVTPYEPFSPVLLVELGETLALAGVRQWHILPLSTGSSRDTGHAAAAVHEIQALREHLPWLEIRYGNPMAREQELCIDVHGRVLAVESVEPRSSVLTGDVEGLATGDLLTDDFLARHAGLWVSWTQPADEQEKPLLAAPQVFISYNHHDRDLAASLEADLEAAGVATWMDKSELIGGDLWHKQIQAALDRCPVVIGAIGPSGIGDFQDLEISAAARRASRGEGRFLPVLLPGADFDSIPSLLENFQYIDFSISGTEPLRQLLRAIQSRPAVAAPPQATQLSSGSPRSNTMG